MKQLSKTKIKNFQTKIKECMEEELSIRNKMRVLYDQLVLDAEGDAMAHRYAQQAFFHIQKERSLALLKQRLEFHPFFSSRLEEEGDVEE